MKLVTLSRSGILKIVVAIVILGTVIATFSGIEFFPFSSYTMYSNLVRTEPYYSYYRYRLLLKDGTETQFYNKDFGIFFYNQQLEESTLRNLRAGKRPSHIVRSIYSDLLERIEPETRAFVGLRLYEIRIDWPRYKNCFLEKQNNCEDLKLFSTEKLLAEFKE